MYKVSFGPVNVYLLGTDRQAPTARPLEVPRFFGQAGIKMYATLYYQIDIEGMEQARSLLEVDLRATFRPRDSSYLGGTYLKAESTELASEFRIIRNKMYDDEPSFFFAEENVLLLAVGTPAPAGVITYLSSLPYLRHVCTSPIQAAQESSE